MESQSCWSLGKWSIERFIFEQMIWLYGFYACCVLVQFGNLNDGSPNSWSKTQKSANFCQVSPIWARPMGRAHGPLAYAPLAHGPLAHGPGPMGPFFTETARSRMLDQNRDPGLIKLFESLPASIFLANSKQSRNISETLR